MSDKWLKRKSRTTQSKALVMSKNKDIPPQMVYLGAQVICCATVRRWPPTNALTSRQWWDTRVTASVAARRGMKPKCGCLLNRSNMACCSCRARSPMMSFPNGSIKLMGLRWSGDVLGLPILGRKKSQESFQHWGMCGGYWPHQLLSRFIRKRAVSGTALFHTTAGKNGNATDRLEWHIVRACSRVCKSNGTPVFFKKKNYHEFMFIKITTDSKVN